jgi:Helix-turn-helix domain
VSETINMSRRELSRVEVMQQLKAKRITQSEAAEQLGLTVRQIKRLWRAYRAGGAQALVSKRRGCPSNHQLNADVKSQALELIESRYPDFGPTLAHEKLTEVHHLRLGRETLRQLMVTAGHWEPHPAKAGRAHPMRPRRPRRGELVQIDGSPHAWFEDRGPACTLLAYIDDATGQVQELFFAAAETTFSYFAATRRYLTEHGKPLAFYSDKHGIFRINAEAAVSGSGLSQFGRATPAPPSGACDRVGDRDHLRQLAPGQGPGGTAPRGAAGPAGQRAAPARPQRPGEWEQIFGAGILARAHYWGQVKAADQAERAERVGGGGLRRQREEQPEGDIFSELTQGTS